VVEVVFEGVFDPVSFPDQLSRSREDPDVLLEPTFEPILLDLELRTGLKVRPELLGGAEIAEEAGRGDGPLVVDDLDGEPRFAGVEGIQ